MPVPVLVKNGCTKTENQHIFYASIDVTQFLYMLLFYACYANTYGRNTPNHGKKA